MNEDAKKHDYFDHMNSYSLKIARLTLYLIWTVSLMPIQWVGLALNCRWVVTLPAFYHRWCCRILGFRIRSIGNPTAQRPALFAANHVSYTDITILGSLIPGSFIAKAEVAEWPFFGRLAKLQRTVFLDRKMRSAALHRDALSGRLVAGDALILFPEGTSGDGNRPLPFKTALFAAADVKKDARSVVVQPVSLAYTRLDGIPIGRSFRPLFSWYGAVGLVPHLWGMIGLGTVETVVQFHPPTFLADCGSRKILAGYCRARIAGGMAAALFGRPQPMPPPPVPPARGELLASVSRAAA
jgi:1-acyl-sn-glycerol-3-phosphate acyltransferase